MLISLQNIFKSFGENTILDDVNVVVSKQDRIGIIGENGAGKTTLLKVLCGEYEIDKGDLYFAKNVRLGYLEQNHALNPALTIYQEMEKSFSEVLSAMDRMKTIEEELKYQPENTALLEQHDYLFQYIHAFDGYHMEVQIKKILNGMGFPVETWDKLCGVLSGGENTRLRLAKLLAQNPDVLILDEPTNHLDFITMEWLENYLQTYSGAVLVVSHDRYFLDAICNRIFEIENTKLICYKGNYSAYLPQKEMAQVLQQKQHEANVQKAQKLEDYIARNIERASTSSMAKSRRKQLEKLEITQAPRLSRQILDISFEYDQEPYKDLVIVKNLSIQIPQRTLINNLNLLVERGQRLIIAGPNGTGKSTLLQVLEGKLKPTTGSVRLGTGAKFGIFEQQQLLKPGNVLTAFWNQYPKMIELEVRSHLAHFGFRGEDVFKPCSTLSGGELARLRFAELVLERPNLMFLDEPTNHLDVYTRESLGKALENYTGTMILVTHDRYLMNSLSCPILYIENGQANLYSSYTALMNRNVQTTTDTLVKEKESIKSSYGKENRKRKAELRNEIKKLEQQIEQVEQENQELEVLISDPNTVQDYKKIEEYCHRLEELKSFQQKLLDQWSELVEEQENLE